MSEELAPAVDIAVRQQLEPAAADAVLAYAVQTRADADRFTVVLDPREDLREAHLARLTGQRPAVA